MYYFVEGVSGAGKSTYVKDQFQENYIVIEGDYVKPSPFYNGKRIHLDEYKKQHIDCLASLQESEAQSVVIVGGLMHGAMYDLIGIYDLNKSEIVKYFESVITCVPKDSKLIYLETDNLSQSIKAILKERYLLRPEWIRGIFDYLTRVSMCRKLGWQGENGVLQLMQMIYKYDKAVLQALNIDKKTIVRDL